MTQTPSHSPVIIGSTTEYTIVAVSCTGLGSDTIAISWSLNRHSINSATHIESNNTPFAVSSSTTFTSTLTTVGDIGLSNAGQYKCTVSLLTAGICHSSTTDFDVKCKLNTSAITIINNGLSIYFDSTCPFNYCY